jgi:SAM-dependent methyltransferase
MSNPWLNVPLSDYEGHMGSSAVQQSEPLSRLFSEALTLTGPASVAILGIAGGNGLERLKATNAIHRIVGIDINPDYLDAVRQRFPNFPGLELHCFDLATQTLDLAPVDLVHAALIFEHAGTARALDNALALVAPGGALSVILQLPGDASQNSGNSGYASVQSQSEHFCLVDPTEFTDTLRDRRFSLIHRSRRPVPAGKTLQLSIYARG